MKSKVKKELWVLNITDGDVSISDLGVKVPAGKAVNIFKHNPALTEEQVDKSKANGVFFDKLSSNKLKIVQKQAPTNIKVVEEASKLKQPLKATITKSSVIIDSTKDEVTDSKGFDFADYGVDDSIIEPVKEGAGVVVKVKEDTVEVLKSSPPQNAINQNGVVLLESQTETLQEAPQVKTEPAKVEPEPVKESTSKASKDNLVSTPNFEGGIVVTAIDKDSADPLPEPKKETKEPGMRVASRTKPGITVMKIKG